MFQRLIYIPTQRAERLPTVRRTDMLIERFLSSLRYVRNDAHFQRNKGLSAAASPPPTTPTNDANPLRGDPCGPCGRLPCGHLRCGHLRPCKGFDCNPLEAITREATTRVAPTRSNCNLLKATTRVAPTCSDCNLSKATTRVAPTWFASLVGGNGGGEAAAVPPYFSENECYSKRSAAKRGISHKYAFSYSVTQLFSYFFINYQLSIINY